MPIRVRQFTQDTAGLLAVHALNPERYPFLLQSTAQGISNIETPVSARYDLLFAFPQERIGLYANDTPPTNFLQELDTAWQQASISSSHEVIDLPFRGGWFLYLGYELAGEIEPSLRQPRWQGSLPVACAVRIPAAIIHDRHENTLTLFAEAGHEHYLELMETDIVSSNMARSETPHVAPRHVDEEPPEQYLSAIERTKQYIYEGDIFQANLSRLWQAKVAVDNYLALYQNLCRSNPAPFAGLAHFGKTTILSSSPERLVSVVGRQIETRPIAGTRPRVPEQSSDQDMRAELVGHAKERAEHVMLVDLERNDLGRICIPGSIKVTELLGLESYAHVHHIVSNIVGVLRPEITPAVVIRAVFPGGTITGCPKVRCMEIIAELEGAARGPYTGSMGYLNHDGSMDLNILIRTLWQEEGKLLFRAGGGIVADSEPEQELAETRAKARGMLRAIQAGVQ